MIDPAATPATATAGSGDGDDDALLLDEFFASLSISDGRAEAGSSSTAATGNDDVEPRRMMASTASAETADSSTGTAATNGVHGKDEGQVSEGRTSMMSSSWSLSANEADRAADTTCGTNRQRRREKGAAVARAPEGQKAWREFRRTMDVGGDDENVDEGATASSTSTAARAPISFSLRPSNASKKAKKKKKGKKSGCTSIAGGRDGGDGTRQERPPPQSSAAADGDHTRCHHNYHHQHRLSRPLWTAVVDTCCFLEDPRGARRSAFGRIVDMARFARTCHHPEDAGAGVACPAPSVGVEAEAMDDVEIVIPHVVWTELDGISKRTDSVRRGMMHADDDDLSYDSGDWQQHQRRRRQAEADELSRLARGATRMLREEMESYSLSTVAGIGAIPGVGVGGGPSVGLGRGVVRSETIADAREAAANFLSGVGDVVNDDRILACVLMEKRRLSNSSSCANDDGAVAPRPPHPQSSLVDHARRAPGGVILLTTDQNLACKAVANGAGVYSPMDFHDLFLRRAEARRRLLPHERYGGAPSAAPPSSPRK